MAGRPIRSTLTDLSGGDLIYRSMLGYDKFNRLTSFKETAYASTKETKFSYDKDNRTKAIDYGGGRTVEYSYDGLGRIVSRKLKNGSALDTAYSFAQGGHAVGGSTQRSTTSLVQKIHHKNPNVEIAYQYDEVGNIVSATQNGKETKYTYDKLGQLTRVDDPHENATWVYEYDLGGNIQRKIKYALGDTASAIAQHGCGYKSPWKDLLTAYDGWKLDWKGGRKMSRRGGETAIC